MQERHSQPVNQPRVDSLFELLSKAVNEKLGKSRIPNGAYKSEVNVFGGKVYQTEDGKWIHDMTEVTSRFDIWGDSVLRKFDGHTITEPTNLFLRFRERDKLKEVVGIFFPKSMRRRGSKEEIVANAQRLGLGDVYGVHEKGIEIFKPEIYTDGRALQDIFRKDKIGSEKLNDIDIEEAILVAAAYIGYVHAEFGWVGEILVNDIFFLGTEDINGKTVVTKPILNLPDIVYNPALDEKQVLMKNYVGEMVERTVGHTKTNRIVTDLMDFVFSVSLEEMARLKRKNSGNAVQNLESKIEELIAKLLGAYSEAYNMHIKHKEQEPSVEHILYTLKSFMKRGRITTMDSKISTDDPNRVSLVYQNQKNFVKQVFFAHNKARLQNYDENVYLALRPAALEAIVQLAPDMGHEEV